jgi:pantoate--beta-alanine ligase
MRAAIDRVRAGEPIPGALATLEAALLTAGFVSIDYARIADADTLAPLSELTERPARLFVAARIGKARLIDNMPV